MSEKSSKEQAVENEDQRKDSSIVGHQERGFYPVDLVDKLDELTVARNKRQKRGKPTEQSLKDDISQTVRELMDVRPPWPESRGQ